jgi:hypothetical protein
MTNCRTDEPVRAIQFREEAAKVTRELLAHDLVPAERQESVRDLLDERKPGQALHFALFGDGK